MNSESSGQRPVRPRASRNYSQTPCCSQGEEGECEHGAFSPTARPGSPTSLPPDAEAARNEFGGRYARSTSLASGVHGVVGDAIADGIFGDGRIFGSGDDNTRKGWNSGDLGNNLGWKKNDPPQDGGGTKPMSTTQWLAKNHGVRNNRSMYVSVTHLNLSVGGIDLPLTCHGLRIMGQRG